MTTKKQAAEAEGHVIWESFVIRSERDLAWLWQGLLREGDVHDNFVKPPRCSRLVCRKFFFGLHKWREKLKAPIDKAPLCLACEQTFCGFAQHPLAFLMTYTEDPRIDPDLLILTGICERCEKKSDEELLKHGSELIAKFLNGRALGFSRPLAQGMH